MTLRPTTARLRQLIREHGASGWTLLQAREVACFNGQLAFYIRSHDGRHERWVLPGDVEKESE